MYYYKGRMVSSPRFFTVGNEHKVEFKLDGETHITDGSEVVDYDGMKLAQKALEGATKALEKSVEKHNEVKETEETPKEEVAKDIDNKEEEEKDNQFTQIVATNVKTKRKYKLDTEQEFNKFVTRYKLDEAVIQDVLDGKQKTHKGFSFDK